MARKETPMKFQADKNFRKRVKKDEEMGVFG
jgi:hypothetical protein